MHRAHNRKGFTLAELLITLIVTGILLSALATLAYALSSATSTDSDTAVVQAQLRLGTLRLQDLVGNCRMICQVVEGRALAIWRADDNQDGQINVNEVVYLDVGTAGDTLQLCTFSSTTNPQLTFSSGTLSLTMSELIASHGGEYIELIPDADSVQLAFDAAPPLTRQLTVSFTLTEDGRVRPYDIDMTLRAWAGHLLNEAGNTLVSDDDE